MISPQFQPPQETKEAARNWKIRSVIMLVHILCIGLPFLWSVLDNYFRPPKVNMFRVKIGPKELSTAPEVGPPERTRPTGTPPREPSVPVPPKEPSVPVPPKEPKVKIPQKPKPKAKPKPKKKSRPKAKPKKKVVKKPTASKRPSKRKPARPRRNLESEVYRPKPGTNEFRAPGGTNFNQNVRIGTRNRGQQRGPQDNRTPGGGLTEELESFYQRAGLYLKNVGIQPPNSLLGNSLPEVTIELQIAADGRVTGKRILKSSGIQAMDDSVKRLLSRLERMPMPPRAAVIEFVLVTDD